MYSRRGLIAAGILVLAAVELHAAEIEPCAAAYEARLGQEFDADQVWSEISAERQSGCILGSTDTTDIRQLYLDLQRLPPGPDLAVKREQLFDRLSAQFENVPSSDCDNDSTACIVGRHVAAIRRVQELLSSGQPNWSDTELSKDQWTVVGMHGDIRISDISLHRYLVNECKGGVRSAGCRAAVEIAAKVLRSTEATLQAISAHAKPIIQANDAFLTLRDTEWNSYFNDVSVQYPWELALNSWRFQKSVQIEQRMRFPRAPEQKLIALHPSPAFEYAKVSHERSSQAAVVVEVLGFERWRWREGAAISRIGASIAVSFSDVPGADTMGYGLMFRTPMRNMSVGAVWRDTDEGDSINLIFNFDIARLIQKYRDADVIDFVAAPPQQTSTHSM